MEALLSVFSAFGLSASAGLNAYIPLLVIALAARFTNLIKLTPPWDTLTNGWVIGIITVLLLIEIFADKVPAVNHINDILQTFVRPVAGAIVFAASANVISDIHPVVAIVAGILVAGSVHAVKSVAIRPAVTASTAGTANVPVSIAEDAAATGVSILSLVFPVCVGTMLIFCAALVVWWLAQRSRRGTAAV